MDRYNADYVDVTQVTNDNGEEDMDHEDSNEDRN